MTMMRPDRSNPQAIELLLEQGRLNHHPVAKMARVLAQVTGDTQLLEELAQMARLRSATNQKLHPFSSPLLEDLPATGLVLGNNVFASSQLGPAVYLPPETLSRHPHLLVSGASGTGKSWHMMHLAREIIEAGDTVWLVDSEGDFSSLLGALGPEKVWVMRYDQFRRNPLEPLPREDPLVPIGRIKTALREAGYMRDGSVNLLGETVHKLYVDRGVIGGGDNYPCLEDVFVEAKRARWRLDSRRGQYCETLLSRLGSIIDNMGPTYRCRKGYPIAELAAHSIVFNIVGLSRDLAHFFLDDLVLWIADWKLRSL